MVVYWALLLCWVRTSNTSVLLTASGEIPPRSRALESAFKISPHRYAEAAQTILARVKICRTGIVTDLSLLSTRVRDVPISQYLQRLRLVWNGHKYKDAHYPQLALWSGQNFKYLLASCVAFSRRLPHDLTARATLLTKSCRCR